MDLTGLNLPSIEERKSRKVVIATAFYMQMGFSPYMVSLARTIKVLESIGQPWDFLEVAGDSYVERAKNSILHLAMEIPDMTDLFMIDSDESWDVAGFLRVLYAPPPFVGALYPCKNNWDFWGGHIYTTNAGTPKCNADGLIHAQHVPGGFLRLKRAVIQSMFDACSEYYFDSSSGYKGKTKNVFRCVIDQSGPVHGRNGEDVNFCNVWRGLGGDIYVEPRVEIGHYGVTKHQGSYHEYLLGLSKEVK